MKYLFLKNKKSHKLFFQNEAKKLKYKSVFYNRSLPNYLRQKSAEKLFHLSKNCSYSYLKNGCLRTHKNRSVFKRFKLSRIKLRLLASNNFINGIKKKIMHPLSNMISGIKVASLTKSLNVTIQNSKLCASVLSILYRLGYIRGYTIRDKKKITVLLKYKEGMSIIRNINVISTPGRRTYINLKSLKKNVEKNNAGFYVLSTSRGLMTDQESLMFSVGGEVLLRIS